MKKVWVHANLIFATPGAAKSVNCLLCKQFMQQVNGALTKPENEAAVSLNFYAKYEPSFTLRKAQSASHRSS